MSSNTALQRREIQAVIEENKQKFIERLPAGVDGPRFVLGLATAIQKQPKLLECDPKSVLLAAYDAAELGCSLSPSLALGWLIPYGRECNFQPSYRFFIQRAHETGDVKSFFAEVVYKGDEFNRQFAPKRNLFHAPGLDNHRTKENALGAYAFVEFNDGSIDWEFMTAEQIGRHRDKSKQPNSMKWTDFWEEGWRITPIRVLAKRLPIKSRNLEAFVEAINKDTERDIDIPPDGSMELDKDSPLLNRPAVVPAQPERVVSAEGFQRAGMSIPESQMVSYRIGQYVTTINGNVSKLSKDMKHLSAELHDDKSWTIPIDKTTEFLEICQKRGVPVTEIQIESEEESESTQGSLL